MLDGARDADRDVGFGGDDLARLTDLIVVQGIARVDRGARAADPGAEPVRKRVDQRVELLRGAERAPARDDDLGAGQFGPLGLGELGREELRFAAVARSIDGFDCPAAAFARPFRTRCRGR